MRKEPKGEGRRRVLVASRQQQAEGQGADVWGCMGMEGGCVGMSGREIRGVKDLGQGSDALRDQEKGGMVRRISGMGWR